MNTIRIAQSDEEIARCFPVMRQLRPRLADDEFINTVRRQQRGGYHLVYLENDGRICCVAGMRVLDNLAGGRILYVDDLVTDADARSQGHGKTLFAWLVERAKEERCRSLELDSGVQRFDAHRFYLENRMFISSHHFRLEL